MSTETKENATVTPVKQKIVRISSYEAKTFQNQLIRTWKPSSDVWPLKFGGGVAASAAALMGAYCNQHYRKVTLLGSHGLFTSFLPAVVIPSMGVLFAHMHFITSDVVIQETRCSVCVELRATAIQLALGFVLPLVTTTLAAFFLSTTYQTYAVPPVFPIRAFAQHWLKISRPLTKRLHILLILQASVAAAVTYSEYYSIEKVNKKLDIMQGAASVQ